MALPTDQQPSQVGTYEKILTIANRIMHGGEITKEEAIELIHTSDDDTMILLAMADKIRQHFNDNSVDVCAIVNARSGKCPENCKFCAQSAHHETGVQVYPFMDDESILDAARKAKEAGAIRFSIVTSGRNTNNPNVAAMAGYALAKKRFVGRKLLFTLIVCAMALPKQVILIPLLREMSSLNLYNTIWAVIFPIVGWPFGVFLMKQFSEGIPTEMLEAARIDGASEAKTFIDIVLPMVKPGIGALAIFTFINSWNDYFMQLIMLSSTSNLTISLGIAKLQAENSTDFGLIMAGAALAAVPIIIIFLIFQKYFTKGIAMGAVKG